MPLHATEKIVPVLDIEISLHGTVTGYGAAGKVNEEEFDLIAIHDDSKIKQRMKSLKSDCILDLDLELK